MSDTTPPPAGPDLRRGVSLDDLEEGRPLAGRVGDEPVLLVRHAGGVSAVGARCPHYGAPLEEGLVAGETLRCPWHHACFSLRTGEVLGPPALDDLPRWEVEVEDGWVRVGPRAAPRRPRPSAGPLTTSGVVIVGAGAAGTSAAQTLRREGYPGAVTLVDPDPDAPYDRPNLSKDYLAGDAPEAWLPLRPAGFFQAHDIDRRVARAARIDPDGGVVELDGGGRLFYDALILATGARPRRLDVPGADLPHVHTLRSLADCRALIDAAGRAREVVVVGAGFIGVEAAAALRRRGLGVTVVAPDAVPLGRVLGERLGRFVLDLHERHGVRFAPGRSVTAVDEAAVTLDDGSRLAADLLLVAVGVEPDTRLARAAGLAVDDGVLVDAGLATDAPGVWAAGDAAAFPHPRTGARTRVEHWAAAQRQGMVAARNILGAGVAYDAPPFFWTRIYDTSIAYVGHAGAADRIEVRGDPEAGGAEVRFVERGETAAVATVGRPRASLEAEVALEALWRLPALGAEAAE